MNDNLSTREKTEVFAKEIIKDIVSITTNRNLDILDWQISIGLEINLHELNTFNKSISLVYRIDSNYDCITVFDMINYSLGNKSSKITLPRSGNKFIILWNNFESKFINHQ